MKYALWIALVIIVVVACSTAKKNQKAANQKSGQVLSQGAKILDVRSAEEFEAGHLPQALNVPVDELAARIKQVVPDKNTPLLVHCQSGFRSARAKKILDAEGYTKVTDLGSLAHARQVIEGK